MFKERSSVKVGKGESGHREQRNTGALPRTTTASATASPRSKIRTSLKTDAKSEPQTKRKSSSATKAANQNRRPGVQKYSENKPSGTISRRQEDSSSNVTRQVSSNISKNTSISSRSRSGNRNSGKQKKKSEKSERSKAGSKKIITVITCPSEQSPEVPRPLPVDTYAACQAAFMHSIENQSAPDDGIYFPLQDVCPTAHLAAMGGWTTNRRGYEIEIAESMQIQRYMGDLADNRLRSSEQTAPIPVPTRSLVPAPMMSMEESAFSTGSVSSKCPSVNSSTKSMLDPLPDKSRKRRTRPKTASDSSISDLSDSGANASAVKRSGFGETKYTDECAKEDM